MKKITLLFTVIFLLGNTVQAQVRSLTAANNHRIDIDEPIYFNERGIDFFVFPNGEFDFNTEPNTDGDIIYRKGRRNCNSNVGVLIEHDNQGRVRRIGNVFLNYDFQNRIKRIGSIYMKYNRFALTQIGGMKLIYNYHGELINTIGFVKGNCIRYGYCYTNSEDDNKEYSSYYFRKNGLRK